MLLAVLDEFGHEGPYISADDPKHSSSPVFGYCGFIIPEHKVENFVEDFQKIKASHPNIAKYHNDNSRAEIKGSEVFTGNAFEKITSSKKQRNFTRFGVRLCYALKDADARIAFYGVKKYNPKQGLSSVNLHQKTLKRCQKLIEAYSEEIRDESQKYDSDYIIIVDEHNNNKHRVKAIEADRKIKQHYYAGLCDTICQGTSSYSQLIQAADWLAAILGKIAAFRTSEEWEKYLPYDSYFAKHFAELGLPGARIDRHTPDAAGAPIII